MNFHRKPKIESRTPARGGWDSFRSRFLLSGSRFSRAFTLLEIMLAITIFTMVMAAIYSSWLLILRSTKVGEEASAQVQRRRMAVWAIEDALNCVQSFQASSEYYSFVIQNGDDPLLSFTARLPGDYLRHGEFGGLTVRRLTFTVEPGPDSEKDLVLRQNSILMDMSKDEEEHPLVLARHVKKFEVECWDPKESDWSKEWDDTNQTPTMVRFTLVLGGDKRDNSFGDAGPSLAVTRVVAIPTITVPSAIQTQSAGGGRPPIRPGIPGSPR